MRQLYAAEVKGSWQGWLGVCLAFVAVNFGFIMGGLFISTGLLALRRGIFDATAASQMFFVGGFNVLGSLLAGASVVSSSTALVIASRRGAIARLALAGATPDQVVRVILVQLAVVTLACAVVGDLLAAAVYPVFLTEALRGTGTPIPPIGWNPVVFVAANLVCVLASVVLGWRQARAASRIPAIEALRPVREETAAQKRRNWVWRWIVIGWGVLTIAGTLLLLRGALQTMGREGGSIGMVAALWLLFVTGFVIQAGGPVAIRGLTRAWTALVPGNHPTWFLARNTVLVKAERLSRSVTPIMYAVALLFGMLALGDTFMATLKLIDPSVDDSGAGIMFVVIFAGAPLVVSMAGSVGSLVMMARQRDAELALASIVGATPRQRVLLPVFEALIMTTTAVILGLVMSAVALGTMLYTLHLALPESALSVPVGSLIGCVLVSLLVSIAATLGPSLASLRRPAPEVIARLVAD